MADRPDILLLLDALLGDLAAQGFYLGVDDHLRIAQFLANATGQSRTLETLKFQLAALVCRSAEDQQKFYQAFDDLVRQSLADFLFADENDEQTDATLNIDSETKPNHVLPEILALDAARQRQAIATARSIKGRSGPIRIELTSFPNKFWRIWNTAKIDAATVPLREKEWTPTTDWDLPASIRYTIQQGGIPHLVSRQRKRMPQYLFLIDQRSTEDHLAGLYVELALEMRRRDLAAEYYFYHDIPGRCWRDRHNPRTYTSIQRLQNEYDGYKLLIVGEASGLLDRPYLRPSNLAHELAENWRNVALLCTKSTAEWERAELTLCQLFPVVPATAEGLHSLVRQWSADEVLTPNYWRNALPAPSAPILRLEVAPEEEEEVIDQLKYYLGRDGFHWLCAAATHPGLFWRLTALFNDESIVPRPDLAERDQNQIWQNTLLRISRLRWLREGFIPEEIRVKLQGMLPADKVAPVRRQLLEILDLNKDQVPERSYAAADYAFAMARYDFEQATYDPQTDPTERMEKEIALRKAISNVAYSDVQDPVGQSIWNQQSHNWPPVPDTPGLHVLWVDDEPKNNVRFQDELNELLHAIFTNVRSTEEALETLAERGFNMIVSDISRHRRDGEGANMLRVFRDRNVSTPVIFYTTPAMVEKYESTLRELGAAGVFYSHELVRNFMRERLQEKQQQNEPASNAPPENIVQSQSQSQSQQQSYTPPPDTRIAAAREAQDAGDAALENKNYEVADANYKRALDLFSELKDDTGRANTHQALGKLYVETGNLEAALQHFKSASTLYLLLNFNPAYAYALMDIGGVQQKMGLLEEARKSYEETLEILEELGDKENLVEVHNALGLTFYDQKKYTQSIQSFKNALKLTSNLSNNNQEAGIRNNLALVLQNSGNLEEALEEFQKALEIYTDIHEKGSVILTERAISLLRKTLNLKKQVQTFIASGRTEEALTLLANSNDDALLLQAQFNSGKKDFSLGLIDFSEWQRIQAQVNYGVLEMAGNLTDDAKSESGKGLILYTIPATMQVGKKTRCSVRIAANIEMLEKDRRKNAADLQETIQIAETMSVELAQAADNESDEGAFDIQRRDSPSKQKVNPTRYAQWNFDVEPEQPGTYRLTVNINLFGQGDRGKKGEQTVVFEREVTVTAPPSQKTKKAPPSKASRKK